MNPQAQPRRRSGKTCRLRTWAFGRECASTLGMAPRQTSKKNTPAPTMKALVTGYPGFIAKRLVGRLLAKEGCTVVCLVEESRLADAEQELRRLPAALQARLRLTGGDVRKMDLGLAGLEIDGLADTTHVFHLAGVQATNAPPALLEAVNVTGVRNTLVLAREFQQLKRFVHFSSCFVSGDRQGVVLEEEIGDDADVDPSWVRRSAYEDSKWRGEMLARQAMADMPVSIVRPSVVVGDSATGEVDRFDGVYAMGILIVTSPMSVPIPLPGPGIAPLHLVPVDYLTQVVCRIAEDPTAAGRTFHIVDPNPLSARMIYDLVAERSGKKRTTAAVVPKRLSSSLAFSLATKRFSSAASSLAGPWLDAIPGFEKVRRGAQAVELFDRFVVYNADNTARLLAGTDITCPRFDTYVDTLVKFVRDSIREERKTRKRQHDPLL